MINDKTLNKLKTLTEAAKYDVSCASSGSRRTNTKNGIGSAAYSGICHSFTSDGRCVSLFKIMLSNYCIYDCAYCVNRRSNDVPRATFTPEEIIEITLEFYKRNYIEGLFLSSGVIGTPDNTMELMLRVVKGLRTMHRFNGYIHMKAIPGASRGLIDEAGLYADRMSVNIEIPSEPELKMIAPDKDFQSVFTPMAFIRDGIVQNVEERSKFRKAPRYVPGGQSTQLIIGATPETDKQILDLTASLYSGPQLKRVYYSGYIPVNNDARLPALKTPPLKRENRLYQADWLLRFYHFDVKEILDDSRPNLDLDVDPKTGWALRHPEFFPVDVNTASYEAILRVPGIGVKSAKLIVASRRYGRLAFDNLKKMGVVMKRARYFLMCRELPMQGVNELGPDRLRELIAGKKTSMKTIDAVQMTIDFGDDY
ncbi:putative DNA modification/repair radical SAM protein [Porphyromonas pogonae]|uniref:putative DNA modification/repair radical SAM protein n=1 Tax=Porphyromonas pogonae TaxID=867595 RepID=UPI0038B63234